MFASIWKLGFGKPKALSLWAHANRTSFEMVWGVEEGAERFGKKREKHWRGKNIISFNISKVLAWSLRIRIATQYFSLSNPWKSAFPSVPKRVALSCFQSILSNLFFILSRKAIQTPEKAVKIIEINWSLEKLREGINNNFHLKTPPSIGHLFHIT